MKILVTIFWLGLFLLSLGTVDIYVKYANGYTIKLNGWLTPLINKVKSIYGGMK